MHAYGAILIHDTQLEDCHLESVFWIFHQQLQEGEHFWHHVSWIAVCVRKASLTCCWWNIMSLHLSGFFTDFATISIQLLDLEFFEPESERGLVKLPLSIWSCKVITRLILLVWILVLLEVTQGLRSKSYCGVFSAIFHKKKFVIIAVCLKDVFSVLETSTIMLYVDLSMP